MENKNHCKILPQACQDRFYLKKFNNNKCEGAEKSKSQYTVGGMQIGAATMENNMDVPKEIKNITPIL